MKNHRTTAATRGTGARAAILTAALALLGCAFHAPIAQASSSCQLGLSLANVALNWSASLGTQQITFTVTRRNSQACSYVVVFSKSAGTTDYNRRMTAARGALRYQLYKDAALTNTLKDQPDVTSANDAIVGSFSAGQGLSQTQTFYLQIPYSLATTPSLKPPGLYVDNLVVSVFGGAIGSLVSPDATAHLGVATTVPRDIELSLVPSGGGFDPNSTAQTLDFGTLAQGMARSLDLRVLSNAGYVVTFSSQNNGNLVLSGSGGQDPSTRVPYRVTVNSAAQNLAGSATNPVPVATGWGQTTTSGIVNPVLITIGDVSGKVAGRYSDNITVTVATTE